MASRQEVTSFIRGTFRSAWTIELLLTLKNGQHSWPRAELVKALRASDLVVSRGVEELVAAGLILIEESGTVCYRPVSPALDGLVREVEAMYAKSPDAVRRIIVSSAGVSAFADAFRLRKD